jgi:hypothetical protein
MEDDPPLDIDDGLLVEQVAREITQRHGKRALVFAREQSEIAAELNDAISVKAWRDIAEAIEGLQPDQRPKLRPSDFATFSTFGAASR